VITGLDEANAIDGVTVFAAGVGEDEQGRLVTAGGRVLAVTGKALTIGDARELAYRGAAEIDWRGKQHRTDIAALAAGGTA
jgi:phosphoribosylamine--glycine ligase